MKQKRAFAANWSFLVLCVMGAFAILSSTMSKSPVLNPFATSLGTPSDLLGFVAAASTIPGILISLPAASLSDIIGRRKVLLFSAFVFASAPFLYLFVGTWWQLALVRFYHGFATAIFVPVTEATVAEQFPTKRGERISILNSVTGVGRTLAPLLGGAILALTSNGYHALYLAVGVAGVTTFVLAFLLLTEKKKPIQETVGTRKVASKMFQGWREIIRNRGAVLVSLVQASQYYVFGAVEFFIVGYALEVAHLNAFYAGLFLTAEVASVILARPLLGRLSDKKGRRVPIVLGSLLGAVLVFAIPFTTQFSLLLLFAIGYGVGFAAVISSTSPLMSELAPDGLVGSSMGFLSTMMDVGQTLGPIVSGFILASALQYTGLFASLSLLLLATTVVFAFSGISKAEKQTQTT
ncbi:MAG: MFS transporter [Candidatus Bathyarchaeota archaeon]|nr:MFS transporter [Candidatus Bathyarchaeota archaeon]